MSSAEQSITSHNFANVVSEGMILAADTADGGCAIAFYGDDVPVGTRIH